MCRYTRRSGALFQCLVAGQAPEVLLVELRGQQRRALDSLNSSRHVFTIRNTCRDMGSLHRGQQIRERLSPRPFSFLQWGVFLRLRTILQCRLGLG